MLTNLCPSKESTECHCKCICPPLTAARCLNWGKIGENRNSRSLAEQLSVGSVAQLHHSDSTEYSRLSICHPLTSAPLPSSFSNFLVKLSDHHRSLAHSPAQEYRSQFVDKPQNRHSPIPTLQFELHQLTLHSAESLISAVMHAGKSLSSLLVKLAILATASIPAVLTGPTGRRDRLRRASGGDVILGALTLQPLSSPKNSVHTSRCALTSCLSFFCVCVSLSHSCPFQLLDALQLASQARIN